jgi:hypothetical protein|tara:strand:- start:762 stop:1004 length:243 start_codon:yes stop_codon:yes gene_type:complete
MPAISKSKKENSDRFKRVAEIRTEKVLVAMRSLSKCSNPRTYYYNQAQVNKIFREVKRELRTCEALFSSKSARRGERFKL